MNGKDHLAPRSAFILNAICRGHSVRRDAVSPDRMSGETVVRMTTLRSHQLRGDGIDEGAAVMDEDELAAVDAGEAFIG